MQITAASSRERPCNGTVSVRPSVGLSVCLSSRLISFAVAWTPAAAARSSERGQRLAVVRGGEEKKDRRRLIVVDVGW